MERFDQANALSFVLLLCAFLLCKTLINHLDGTGGVQVAPGAHGVNPSEDERDGVNSSEDERDGMSLLVKENKKNKKKREAACF